MTCEHSTNFMMVSNHTKNKSMFYLGLFFLPFSFLSFKVRVRYLSITLLLHAMQGVNCTYDDEHMWLAPWAMTPGKPNLIYLFFNEPITLSKVLLAAVEPHAQHQQRT